MFKQLWQWLTGKKPKPVVVEPEKPVEPIFSYTLPSQQDVLYISDLPLRAPKGHSYIIDGERWVWDGQLWSCDPDFKIPRAAARNMIERAEVIARERVARMRGNTHRDSDTLNSSIIAPALVMSSIEDVHVRHTSVGECDIGHVVHSSPSHDHSHDSSSWGDSSSCD